MKLLVVLCLVYLLAIEDTDAWRRRRWRNAWRRTVKFTKKVAKVASTIKAAKAAVALLGKRSVTEVMPELNLCTFSSFDHDENDLITEDEITTLIEITGLTDFDELFGQMDKNEDGIVNIEEYSNADVISESCRTDKK